MPSDLIPPPARMAPAAPRPAPGRRTRVFALPEARWAAAALVLFLIALPLQLTGSPAWSWGLLYAAVYVTGGWEPARAGLTALREKTLDVDLLMIVAALGAASIGQTMDGALLIVIFATSGALEALATARTQDAVRGLLDPAPDVATRLSDDGGESTVPTRDLVVGDTVLVRPGERVGADGRVLSGVSEVDQSTITGEPLPAAKQAGDEVFAGTLNGTGALRVKVERDASDSVIARIVAMVEEASRTKAPTQLFIEKVEQRYSLGMVVATVAVFLVPLAFGADLTASLLRAMTFMIVASPCAVVLATMPPLLSAIANAGRHGVLVKSAVVMERLGQVDAVALDKTGTLTEGTPHVADVRPVPGSGLTEDSLLALAAAAEHPSEHPLGRAVVDAARTRGLSVADLRDFTSTPGVGVTATVSGRTVTVGAPARLLDRDDDTATADAAEIATDLEAGGRTAVVVLLDEVPVGVLGIADRLRPDAAATVAALTGLTGATPMLLTGDNPRAAVRLAVEVGIPGAEVHAGLLPQDKVEAVRRLEARGRRTLVLGDGVNDAPALAVAHTGIAMGRAGSDLALETADAVVVRDELAAVPKVIALSRAARRLVVQNLVIAGVFISGLVVWDLAGDLPLPLGVLGHEGSTVIVGLNGLRMLRDTAWTTRSTT
ncbi:MULTISPECIES: heavy metal translocating P-type ATPase [unclassified Streptomyces]|uniref:heavy metal translocating P-type ATPase n=1 Tax=unclassified Streptomyces TaxID=2593676 RepID=UPI00136AD8AA|nr:MULTISPECIES: heavy metal translocating P-type ATPase [unclassified Streptomyces]NEA01588.1 heavy metal translocating P-type ATPase [Streptomyces sp. SID10116]MYY85232.1 heavy metal translocating P-type ATPase [Streptomyces sp. SID335]MYZ16422.1 heavy metal translocating P-type ATPase [Streptomyces sp. SID337]NDZ91165.1 heavy metal translocating P-type ATPase [Streptomyces sp. SID10115]NEB47750.1 heavy metal translocating P-type ATPase [Streptomyces sp. SID339]